MAFDHLARLAGDCVDLSISPIGVEEEYDGGLPKAVEEAATHPESYDAAPINPATQARWPSSHLRLRRQPTARTSDASPCALLRTHCSLSPVLPWGAIPISVSAGC